MVLAKGKSGKCSEKFGQKSIVNLLLLANVYPYFNLYKKQLTLKAGLAPSSSKHFTAEMHRFDAAMCKAVPKSKSLQVESTSETQRS